LTLSVCFVFQNHRADDIRPYDIYRSWCRGGVSRILPLPLGEVMMRSEDGEGKYHQSPLSHLR